MLRVHSPSAWKSVFFLIVLLVACRQEEQTEEPFQPSEFLYEIRPQRIFDSVLESNSSLKIYESTAVKNRRIPGTLKGYVFFDKLILNFKGQLAPDQLLVEVVMTTVEDGLKVRTSAFIRASDFIEDTEVSVQASAGKRLVEIIRPISSAASEVSIAVYTYQNQFAEKQELLAEVSEIEFWQHTDIYRVGNSLQDDLKVLSFNIKSGRQEGSRDNLDKIAEFISGSGADVIMLQEVDKGAQRTENVDQLKYLEEKTGFYSFYTKAIDLEGGEYGIGLLSRYPFVQAESVSLDMPYRDGGWYEKRVLQLATIQVNGRSVGLANTHLHIGEQYSSRQADILRSSLKNRFASGCFVIGGDFNSVPTTSVYQGMTEIADDAYSTVVRTATHSPIWGQYSVEDRIDYIFTKGLVPHFFKKTRVDFSDHDPIMSTFGLHACERNSEAND